MRLRPNALHSHNNGEFVYPLSIQLSVVTNANPEFTNSKVTNANAGRLLFLPTRHATPSGTNARVAMFDALP